MKSYKEIFLSRDKERFEKYLEDAKEGKTKIAVGAVLPHEIIGDLNGGDGGQVSELQWKRMVDDMRTKVNYGVSPDIPRGSYVDSPEIAKKIRFPTVFSLDLSVKFSAINQTFEFEVSPESSIELSSPPGNTTTLVISINSGSTREDVTVGDVNFLKMNFSVEVKLW
ncbi:hypothetical protein Bca101_058018 [Brassica carinata]